MEKNNEVQEDENVPSLRMSLSRRKEIIPAEDENGDPVDLILLEMSGRERDEYLEGMMTRMKYDEAGKATGLSSFQGLQTSLLRFCLKDINGGAIPVERIQEFGAKALGSLFRKAQELNGLNEAGGDAVKNV